MVLFRNGGASALKGEEERAGYAMTRRTSSMEVIPSVTWTMPGLTEG